ncbi:MAG: ParB family chromosome partitioning protein [Phycisphaerales bacterium]
MSEQGTGSKRRRLGRGLSALIEESNGISPVRIDGGVSASSSPPASQGAGQSPDKPTGSPIEIPLADLYPNKYQPRRHFIQNSLQMLAESIKAAGVMQPIIVRTRPAGGYELIAGERRWRAAELAKLKRIPAIIREVDDETAAEWALIENLQREDLNPVDRAHALQRLSDEFGLTHAEVAQRVGLHRPTVSNLVRLLELDEETLDRIAEGTLSMGHGKALLGCTDPKKRSRLALRAVEEEWSVRRTEDECSGSKPVPAQAAVGGVSPNGTTDPATDSLAAVVGDLETRLGEHLGTRVEIRVAKSGSRGRVMVSFYDLDQFDGLLKKLGLPEAG